MLSEKRRHARLTQDLAVRLYAPSAQMVDATVTVCDLSRGGLSLLTRNLLLDVGHELGFSLELPNGSNLSGAAQVRWNRSMGTANAHGLEFVRMGMLERRRLIRYLRPNHFGILDAL